MPPLPVPSTPPRPKALDTAAWLAIGGTLVGSVGTVITVFDDEFAAQVVRTQQGATEAEIAMMTRAVPIAGVIGVLITIGLFTLLALMFRDGRNWARVVFAGLTAFSLVRFLTAAAQTNAELGLMWNLADVACCSAAVVYLFQRESSAYFQARMRRPR
ncbi:MULTISPECIES: hypothetical protein [Actinokineospora]|nr:MULTISPECIES: hypothetical protein [Actinokineospora]